MRLILDTMLVCQAMQQHGLIEGIYLNKYLSVSKDIMHSTHSTGTIYTRISAEADVRVVSADVSEVGGGVAVYSAY